MLLACYIQTVVTVSWRWMLLLCFFTFRNTEILKPSLSGFEWNSSSGKADTICFFSIPPFSQFEKKEIKEYLTNYEEPDFLWLEALNSVWKLLLTWPDFDLNLPSQNCTDFSLWPISLQPLFPLAVATNFMMWCSDFPWLSFSHQLVGKKIRHLGSKLVRNYSHLTGSWYKVMLLVSCSYSKKRNL